MILLYTSTTHVVVFLWVYKTSYHLLISPTPTNLPNMLKIHTGENKIDCQSQIWRQQACYFPANGLTNPDVFQLKTFPIPREIIPQNVSSLGFTVSEELGNIQTDTQTDSLTDRLAILFSDCFIVQTSGLATIQNCSSV